MIEKVFYCDICGLRVTTPPPSQRPPVRLYFDGQAGIQLRPLNDSSASDKVLCGHCQNQLKKCLEAQ